MATRTSTAVAALRRAGPAIGLVLWIAAVAYGMLVEWSYAATPGPAMHAMSRWPEAAQIHASGDRPTLVLFAHPRCPCTRATLTGLSTLLEQASGPIDTVIEWVRPAGVDDAWMESDIRTQALALPGSRMLTDAGGEEAARFGALTSGTVFLYDKGGSLRFSGGITELRGHEGDNEGLAGMQRALAGHDGAAGSYPVFGCALADNSE